MPRYVAFLRGVSPMNARMADLKRCFEAAGFSDVKTILSSGNVAFEARAGSEAALVRSIEAAMAQHLGRTFQTTVRRTDALRKLVETDPYAGFDVPANAKRVVTFLREPLRKKPALPIATDGVLILATDGREVFTAYVAHPKGPVFMTLIEKTFGVDLTTRTWDTVKKCASA
ncbi:MAG: DUF1697 domain-containing protein [Burkholderiales bacterium]|nr:DUF1697 domain-containing protein [Burkholderiales bacterium]